MDTSTRSARFVPKFKFNHPGSDNPLAWPRYKLKECWTLVLCLLQLRCRDGAIIVHNWWGGNSLKFTHEFSELRTAVTDPRLVDAPIIEAYAATKPVQLLALVPAVFLALLPVRGIIFVARALMPRRIDPLVVFCDGHLSGFVLILAAQSRGATTFSLQHGLYRNDDRGSIMAIRNLVADKICLWDGSTRRTFLEAGVPPDRLLQVGEYGFGGLSCDATSQADLKLLCPPYDTSQIKVFRHLESVLPEGTHTLWSLHPMLRADHKDLTQVTVATTDPRPAVAICGDSGALMDALARHIPIITVSDRPLAAAHLTMQEAKNVDPARLDSLLDIACKSLKDDRRMFGFDRRSDAIDSSVL